MNSKKINKKLPTKQTKTKFFSLIFLYPVFITVTLVFTPSTKSLLQGLFLILFIYFSISFSVKFFFNAKHVLWGFLILITKLPVTLIFMLWAFKQSDFHALSFIIGLLIVLPCLVILSYRKV